MNQIVRTAARWLVLFADPRKLRALAFLPRYWRHWIAFRAAAGSEKLYLRDSHPCLGDWVSGTPFDPHLFFQSAWLARRLAAAGSSRHVDIGSDIRMINVLSAFVPTTFLDYRPLPVSLEGLTCGSCDLLNLALPDDSVQSLSCLHVIEHVGLGRYGDPVDPEGSKKAFASLERVVAPGGKLYLSVPVGRPRVCFNAHRVFHPGQIVEILGKLRLLEFSLIGDDARYLENQPLEAGAAQNYGCGLFVFEKA